MSYFKLPDGALTMWVATEADTSDGGRAWMAVATTIDVARQHCQARHDRERAANELTAESLNWRVDESCPRIYGQTAWIAQISDTAFYEVRQIEVAL